MSSTDQGSTAEQLQAYENLWTELQYWAPLANEDSKERLHKIPPEFLPRSITGSCPISTTFGVLRNSIISSIEKDQASLPPNATEQEKETQKRKTEAGIFAQCQSCNLVESSYLFLRDEDHRRHLTDPEAPWDSEHDDPLICPECQTRETRFEGHIDRDSLGGRLQADIEMVSFPEEPNRQRREQSRQSASGYPSHPRPSHPRPSHPRSSHVGQVRGHGRRSPDENGRDSSCTMS